MQAIIIGAGRGARLMPTTQDAPKCFAEVGGRRILDWTLAALSAGGIDRVCFVGGYRFDMVRDEYPQFEMRHNTDWQNNNILASLFYAEDVMPGGFVCCYSDILFTPQIAQRLVENPGEMALAVDTSWLDRYVHRTQHPSDDAEKVTVQGGQVSRVHRAISEEAAYGEFIGVAKFSAAGAEKLRESYHRCRRDHSGQPFREARVFEKAYLIELFQEMIERGGRFAHVDTPGGYIEIDTQQDFNYARRFWESRHLFNS